ncbi:hypothetical protein MMC27_005867 [Xylographa pallens]|nr:hypothetical protein [Xylographa pallens]
MTDSRISDQHSSSHENKSVMRTFLEDESHFSWRNGIAEPTFPINEEAPTIYERPLDRGKKSENAFLSQHRMDPKYMTYKYSFAVKQIHDSRSLGSESKARREVTNMRSLRYPHVAALLGTFKHRDRLNILIYPAACCDLGDLMNSISNDYGSGIPNRLQSKAQALSVTFTDEPVSVNMSMRPRSRGQEQLATTPTQENYSWPLEQTLPDKLKTLKGYFVCLCQALSYLHDQGIRHKDIKPENVLIDMSNSVVLTDFGISKKFEKGVSHVTRDEKLRTPRYQSPEKANDLDRDDSDDIFSLGCVFLEMASLLRGKDWASCKRYFTKIVNVSGRNDAFCHNLEKLTDWIVELSTERSHEVHNHAITNNVTRGHQDHVISSLETIASMLQENPNLRPKAIGLWEKFSFAGEKQCRDCHPNMKGAFSATGSDKRFMRVIDENSARDTIHQQLREHRNSHLSPQDRSLHTVLPGRRSSSPPALHRTTSGENASRRLSGGFMPRSRSPRSDLLAGKLSSISQSINDQNHRPTSPPTSSHSYAPTEMAPPQKPNKSPTALFANDPDHGSVNRTSQPNLSKPAIGTTIENDADLIDKASATVSTRDFSTLPASDIKDPDVPMSEPIKDTAVVPDLQVLPSSTGRSDSTVDSNESTASKVLHRGADIMRKVIRSNNSPEAEAASPTQPLRTMSPSTLRARKHGSEHGSPERKVHDSVMGLEDVTDMPHKLTEYNDYLHELMHGHHARQLVETTRNTYLELVQVRSSIDELRNLMTAVLVLGDRSAERSSINAAQGRNEQMLQSLAKCKGLSLANDAADDEKPPTYHEVTTKTNIAYSAISYNETSADPETATGRVRVAGTYTSNDKDIPVWIEWKTYRVELNRESLKRYPLPENVTRVRELVGLLQQSQMSEFRIPRCVGFFDDRDDTEDSNHPDRFGIVFEKPDPSPDTPGPLSLLDAIIRLPCPSLSVRVVLAHKVANSLLYLHAVKWLHKSLRSDGIIFFPDPHSQEPNLAEPFLSGFEYARPDRDGIGSTGAPQDPLAELYVHPNYQGAEAVGTYRKTFDIYSLGIVLLEIMYWQRIQHIMALPDPVRPKPRELKAIRASLLQDEAPYLRSLKASVGDKIHTAVKSCIEGLTAFELQEGDDEMDGVVGATLQRNVTRRVVNNLRDIVL